MGTRAAGNRRDAVEWERGRQAIVGTLHIEGVCLKGAGGAGVGWLGGWVGGWVGGRVGGVWSVEAEEKKGRSYYDTNIIQRQTE